LIDTGDSDREYGYVKIDVFVSVLQNVDSEPIRVHNIYIEDITPYIK